jgi:hypothetical protein
MLIIKVYTILDIKCNEADTNNKENLWHGEKVNQQLGEIFSKKSFDKGMELIRLGFDYLQESHAKIIGSGNKKDLEKYLLYSNALLVTSLLGLKKTSLLALIVIYASAYNKNKEK